MTHSRNRAIMTLLLLTFTCCVLYIIAVHHGLAGGCSRYTCIAEEVLHCRSSADLSCLASGSSNPPKLVNTISCSGSMCRQILGPWELSSLCCRLTRQGVSQSTSRSMQRCFSITNTLSWRSLPSNPPPSHDQTPRSFYPRSSHQSPPSQHAQLMLE
jgi:hypothetical protein